MCRGRIDPQISIRGGWLKSGIICGWNCIFFNIFPYFKPYYIEVLPIWKILTTQVWSWRHDLIRPARVFFHLPWHAAGCDLLLRYYFCAWFRLLPHNDRKRCIWAEFIVIIGYPLFQSDWIQTQSTLCRWELVLGLVLSMLCLNKRIIEWNQAL